MYTNRWIVVAKQLAYIGKTTNELVKSVDCVWSGETWILNEDSYEYLMRAMPNYVSIIYANLRVIHVINVTRHFSWPAESEAFETQVRDLHQVSKADRQIG